MASLEEARDPAIERDLRAAERDAAATKLDGIADENDRARERTDRRSNERDDVADRRDRVGDERDETANRRDGAAGVRDDAGQQRDTSAEARDRAAEDHAKHFDAADNATLLRNWERSRWAAAVDRKRSSLDREDAATERLRAESDRGDSFEDRDAGARERAESKSRRCDAQADRNDGSDQRSHARSDRAWALADRSASAAERVAASLDGLTGAHLRGPGTTELLREIVRAERTQQQLLLAFVDVDGLRDINNSAGHAAGDAMLKAVVHALRARFRTYDLLIRFGGDEFVCAFPGLPMAEAVQRFEAVDGDLSKTFPRGSITVGLAQLERGDSVADVVARADAALYENRRKVLGASNNGV